LVLEVSPVVQIDLDLQVALGNAHPGRAVPVDAHRSEVDHVDVHLALGDGREHVVGDVQVVVDGVPLVPRGLHRVRRSALLGEVHEGIGPHFPQQGEEPRVVAAEVHVLEPDDPSRRLLPGVEPGGHRCDRGERRDLELDIGVTAGEVVDDGHLMTEVREV
jgi:hypothetical protein